MLINEHAVLAAVWSPDVQAQVRTWRDGAFRCWMYARMMSFTRGDDVAARGLREDIGDDVIRRDVASLTERFPPAHARATGAETAIRDLVWHELNAPPEPTPPGG